MIITDFNVAIEETDSHLSKWIMEQRRLNVAEEFCRQFTPYIPDGGVVADVGACLGDHTVTYAAMVGNAGTVHAFEPNPSAFQCLAHNMGLQHNVILYPCGLGGTTQQARVKPSLNLGATQLVPAEDGTVVIERLDDLATGWKRLDFLKLDCEGWEADVLVGGEETIRRLRPAMLIEINRPVLTSAGRSVEQLLAQIDRLDYSVAPCEPGLSMELEMVDVICLPR